MCVFKSVNKYRSEEEGEKKQGMGFPYKNQVFETTGNLQSPATLQQFWFLLHLLTFLLSLGCRNTSFLISCSKAIFQLKKKKQNPTPNSKRVTSVHILAFPPVSTHALYCSSMTQWSDGVTGESAVLCCLIVWSFICREHSVKEAVVWVFCSVAAFVTSILMATSDTIIEVDGEDALSKQ